MQVILFLLLFPLSVFAQDRTFKQSITQTTDVIISQEANYRERIEKDKLGNMVCVVDMDVEIEGKWHKAHGSYIWDGGRLEGEACRTAAMLARKALTNEIKPSKITSKAEITYEEDSNTKRIDGYRKGDFVNVKQLYVNPSFPGSFAHQGAPCKWFYDVKRTDKGVKQYNLIACQLSSGWVVEDTF